ncbi:MAG: hypothetical protein HYT73_04025 [Candidatus Aenigmarchaeota archaeon]|nr:hypothetical protein [Candidatus Aenigmarchaeota archaeon]
MMSKIAVVAVMFIVFMLVATSALIIAAFDAKSSGLPPSPSVFAGYVGKALYIQSIGSDTVAVRNTGISVVQTQDVEVYIDGIRKTCFWNFPSIAPDAVSVCITSVGCRNEARVVSGDVEDVKLCPPAPPPFFSESGL